MEHNIICSCRNLTKSYGNHQVIHNCDFEIYRSEMVGLVGENGSGKSTFVRCLLGYTVPSQGEVRLHGSIGYCPQEICLNQSYTVDEHFRFMSAVYQKYNQVDSDFLNHLTERFRLSDFRNRLISDLSSGTRQKVQFITSIMSRPDLLILDEPYDGFDWKMYLLFWDIVDELRETGSAVLLISHMIYERERFSRSLELQNGTLYEQEA